MAGLTFENLKKHIERYGPDGVMDAALPICSLTQLVELQETIDKLPRQPRHRKSAEARVRDWLGIPETEEG